ncbi:MAG: YHS domain-containing protein, partial [Candidatus Dormibacteraceae bacterium]
MSIPQSYPHDARSMHAKQEGDAVSRTLVKDPVCGMEVDPGTAVGTFDYQGQKYYFCNPRCLERFQADPKSFLASDDHPEKGSHQPRSASPPSEYRTSL